MIKLSEKWTANQKHLDRAIKRGDEFILSNPPDLNPRGSYPKELDYMSEKGFKLNPDKNGLIPPEK